MEQRDDAGGAEPEGAVRVSDFRVGIAEFVVASYPAARASVLANLSESEQSVALLASAGLRNRDIARRRASAERTVANQLAAVFRKLGIASRAELALLLVGGRVTPRSGGGT